MTNATEQHYRRVIRGNAARKLDTLTGVSKYPSPEIYPYPRLTLDTAPEWQRRQIANTLAKTVGVDLAARCCNVKPKRLVVTR